ncbi:MAG TPA: hypothetical protein VJ837_00005, partial [Candidatus Paceibacterota bacterium]|nr:hypothetical protein [Candidatus Paceibacterota bacterium]
MSEHRLSLMADRDVKGVWTITDPYAMPPHVPDAIAARWFRTPTYEGAGMLLNESSDYYVDPLGYYLKIIHTLIDQNARFVTWRDVIDGNIRRSRLEVLLQFDVDAGPRSMKKLCRSLLPLDVRASLMIHRQAYDWYDFMIEDFDVAWLQEAEAAGWEVGYHNNSIGNVHRVEAVGDYSESVMTQASTLFKSDIEVLSSRFDIRVFTHHGGNSLNRLTPIPPDIGAVCADRRENPWLWKNIRGAFSDGGFMSRPVPLRERVEGIEEGLYFFRNHPVKYANFDRDFDIPPLLEEDAIRLGVVIDDDFRALIAREREKTYRWLDLRETHRLGARLSYASPYKPISARLGEFGLIAQRAKRLRTRRRETFLREYPWIAGDPRVYW